MYRIIALLLAAFVAVSVILAQDDGERIKLDESTSLSNDTGRLIFSYPRGWMVEMDVNTVLFATDDALTADSTLAGDELLGAVTAITDLSPDDVSITEALNTLMDALIIVPPDEVTYEETEEIILRGREVAVRSGNTTNGDVLLAVENVEGTFVFWNFLTAPDALIDQQATIDAMIASADFVVSGNIALTQSITSDNNALAMDYPADWFAEASGGTLLLANSETALFTDPFMLEADQIQGAINVFDPELLIAHGIEVGATPMDVLNGMLTLTAMSGAVDDDLGEVQSFQINGQMGAFVTGTTSDDQRTAGVIYMVAELDDSHAFMVFSTAEGETAQYIDILQRIATSLRFFGAADL